jgi:hypothetical protein
MGKEELWPTWKSKLSDAVILEIELKIFWVERSLSCNEEGGLQAQRIQNNWTGEGGWAKNLSCKRSESDRKKNWSELRFELQKWNLLEICQGNHAKADYRSRFGPR